jgi:predicted DNA-binding transcriptional regulator AlpA
MYPTTNTPNEILTVEEVAAMLKMSRRQIYEQTRRRGQVRQEHPIPTLRINGNLRFRKNDIDSWLDQIATAGRVQ